jgi:hypothetical protein
MFQVSEHLLEEAKTTATTTTTASAAPDAPDAPVVRILKPIFELNKAMLKVKKR